MSAGACSGVIGRSLSLSVQALARGMWQDHKARHRRGFRDGSLSPAHLDVCARWSSRSVFHLTHDQGSRKIDVAVRSTAGRDGCQMRSGKPGRRLR